MQISIEDAKIIAKLASIHIEGEEVEATTQDLNHIFELMGQMDSYDIDESIAPLEQPFPTSESPEQQLVSGRQDQVNHENISERAQESAPLTENTLYLVPKVIA